MRQTRRSWRLFSDARPKLPATGARDGGSASPRALGAMADGRRIARANPARGPNMAQPVRSASQRDRLRPAEPARGDKALQVTNTGRMTGHLTSLEPTRRAWHAVAELVMAGPQHRR